MSCVPPLVAAVEIAQLVAALGQPDRLRGLRRDAVLVPRDVPGDGDDELPHHAREGDDARARLAEALRDAADRAAVIARVEDVGRLHHLLLGSREPAQDRLGDDGIVRGLSPGIEERREAAPALAALARNGRGSRAAFLDPAVVERELLAERTHVDELLAVGREPDRALAGQERPLADRAHALHGVSRHLSHHAMDPSPRSTPGNCC